MFQIYWLHVHFNNITELESQNTAGLEAKSAKRIGTQKWKEENFKT
jgi:hypothetical protein